MTYETRRHSAVTHCSQYSEPHLLEVLVVVGTDPLVHRN